MLSCAASDRVFFFTLVLWWVSDDQQKGLPPPHDSYDQDTGSCHEAENEPYRPSLFHLDIYPAEAYKKPDMDQNAGASLQALPLAAISPRL